MLSFVRNVQRAGGIQALGFVEGVVVDVVAEIEACCCFELPRARGMLPGALGMIASLLNVLATLIDLDTSPQEEGV